MRIRHETLKDEPVNTHFGEIQLDAMGMATNLDELELEPEKLLELPGFVNAEIFPPAGEYLPPEPSKEKREKDRLKKGPTDTGVQNEIDDEGYWNIIRELSEDPKHVNSKGYLDMDVLANYLRAQNYPLITGTRRIEITDRFRKLEEPEVEPEPQKEATEEEKA